MKTKKKVISWQTIHRWIGVLMSVFLLIFCISGLIMNHRSLFSSYSVSRSILPKEYQIRDFNNGIIKGTIKVTSDSILAFGNCGVWRIDNEFKTAEDFNIGFPSGVDNRNVRNIVRVKDGSLWCATQFEIYCHNGYSWIRIPLPECDERITDITLNNDSSAVVALSRSAIYPLKGGNFTRVELSGPTNYESKTTLFKIIWMLHSGELFGIIGKIVVDIIAIIMIILSITGIILFILPHFIKKSRIERKRLLTKRFKWNFKWHDKIGYVTIVLTIIIVLTGMCLRPPLMIPCVLTKASNIPGTVLDSENFWQDKFRGIRWDNASAQWLISTSEGFIKIDKNFEKNPQMVDPASAPPISPMGITVFEACGPGEWLIGSFSGMYKWNSLEGIVFDYFSGKKYISGNSGRPVSNHLISGYSQDLKGGQTVFDYSQGCQSLGNMPENIVDQPMSLWNVALELHVGRCYNSFLGPLSSLFVFFSGSLVVIVLVSGLLVHNRIKRIN